MIVILKRDDLPPEHCDRAVEDLQLDYFRLTSDMTNQAELIVFVEGPKVRFLKHFPEFQSTHSFDVLMRYIRSIAPIETAKWSVKNFPLHRRKH